MGTQNAVAISSYSNIDDQSRDLLSWCRSLTPIWKMKAGGQWSIDLSECQYIGPSAAAILYATYLCGRQLGQKIEIHLPEKPVALVGFCVFSNLAHYLNGKKQADPNSPKNETVPLYQFYDHAYEQSMRVLRLVKRHQRISTDDEVTLTSAIHEVCQNIEDHAESPIGGISCARFFSNRHEVRVAIVDRGVTIPATLSTIRHIDDPVHALRLVAGGRVTSGSKPHNMGLGISNLIGFVRAMSGRLFLVSGAASAHFEAEDRDVQFSPLDWQFPGTGVFFSLTINKADDEHDDAP